MSEKPTSLNIPTLAAELCRQHETSELGGSWNQSVVEALIRKHVATPAPPK
jgi:hypothetical protein